jgi:hypothetical protein
MTISGVSCADKPADGKLVRCLRLPWLTSGASSLLARSWPGQLSTLELRRASIGVNFVLTVLHSFLTTNLGGPLRAVAKYRR